ncbi:MAG: DUF1559 domain-containing protein, partial [Planctomycetales bacterium]
MVAVFLHPSDYTAGGGTTQLPADAPWPAWANSGNNVWGLASYGANFGLFGDRGAKWRDVTDGLTNTIVFTEKYAVSSRPAGYPAQGGRRVGLRRRAGHHELR